MSRAVGNIPWNDGKGRGKLDCADYQSRRFQKKAKRFKVPTTGSKAVDLNNKRGGGRLPSRERIRKMASRKAQLVL